MGRDASEEAGGEGDGQLMRLLAVVGVAEVSFGSDRARWMESRPVS